MWPFTRRKSAHKQRGQWDLSTPLLCFSDRDVYRLSDAVMGTIVLGATGSGKSTGPGCALAEAFLRAGFGGLVLACKKTERHDWERYCRRTGRGDDLVIFDASGKERFSFLDEELRRTDGGAGLTESLVNLLSVILEVAERNSGRGGGEDQSYWRRSVKQLIRNGVDLLCLAQNRVTVPDLYRVVSSAATSAEMWNSEDWRRTSFCYQCLKRADAKSKTERQIHDFELVVDYLADEFPSLSDRTRSVIVSIFTSMTDVLNRSLLYELFSTDTTIRPEDTLDGKIILVDLPVQEFGEDIGTFAAVLWKYCWQRAVERRDIRENARPVFCFADEAQRFCVSYDSQFAATSRSSRAATVWLTQNYSNLLAAFGGGEAKALTDSILGNQNTKILCANSDPVSNEWAASVAGRSKQLFLSAGQSRESFDPLDWIGLGNGSQTNCSFSEQMEYDLDPRTFTTLRCGGPANRWEIDAVVFQNGRQFAANGKTWLQVTFPQDH